MGKNNSYNDGGSLQGDSLDRLRLWDQLSLSEKSEIMRQALSKGIYSLRGIRETYNSYSDGGHLFKDGGTKDSGKQDRTSYAMNYFMNKGLSREAAAGLVGNLMRESGLNPMALNKNGGAYGIAQWLGPRKKKLFETYGNNPSFEQQLDYVWNELNSTHKKGLEMLRASKTVDEAARNAFGYYEFSAGPEAAIAALNKTGLNTRWKNPPGQKVMIQGINNALKAYGKMPDSSVYAPAPPPLPQFQLLPRTNDITSSQSYFKPVKYEEKNNVPAFMKKKDDDMLDPFTLLKVMSNENKEEQPVQEALQVQSAPMFTVPIRTFEDGGDTNTYNAGMLPEITVTAPIGRHTDNVSYQDPYTGEWKIIGTGGSTITVGPGFNPSNSKIITDPEQFEKAKVARAKKDDLNHYQDFGNKVMNGAEMLVTAPIPMEGINYLISKGMKSLGSVFKSLRPFKSELDWSPENWFKTRLHTKWNSGDAEALERHIPEYHAIEKEAKANGTWLKMSDGSTWEGDPRSWVQLQSKDGQKLMQKPLYHGRSTKANKDSYKYGLSSDELWTSSNRNIPFTYGEDHYTLAVPKGTEITSVDLQGRNFNNIADLGLGAENTDGLLWTYLKDDGMLEMKDVVDAGSTLFGKEASKLPTHLPNESFVDYINRVMRGNDYVIGYKVPKKSLLGNNGSFNLLDPNIYRSVLPFAFPIATLRTTKTNNNTIWTRMQ